MSLKASGLAAGNVLLANGSAIAVGDLIAGRAVRLRCDSAGNFRFASYAPSEITNTGAVTSQTVTVLDQRIVCGDTIQIYANPGTTNWTVPTGVTKVHVQVWGAGGGGSGNSNAAGAGGGKAEGTYAVTPGQVIPITVGAGGAGTAGAVNGNPPYGGNGGTSSFGSFCSATGGTGGQAGQTPGGQGSGGAINLTGASGLDLDTTNSFAAGGSAPMGGGGSSQAAGVFPGGGGGASTSYLNSSIPNAGYAGASGCVITQY